MEAAIANVQSSVYRDEFDQASSDRAGWLEPLQRRGIERFEALGFPTRRQEAWRRTDLSKVTGTHYRRAETPGALDGGLAGRAAAFAGHRLVFVDGVFDAANSDLGRLPAGVTVAPLSEYGNEAPERLSQRLGALADTETNPFIALNTALFRDGAYVHAARGALAEQPVILVHVVTAGAGGRAVYPRAFVHVEAGAEVRVIEQFLSADDAQSLVVPVTEIDTRDSGIVDYCRLQEEGESQRHLGGVHIAAGRDATVRTHHLSAGSALARIDLYADLLDTGADVDLNGLYLTRGRQFSDQHTWMNHRAPHGSSRQVFRGILQGRSETVFDGLVKVFKGAQKTDAQQQNRNLLLDRMALAHSNPRLEIYADDVKCAHGSTVGELEDDALFYLRSRGLSVEDAQALLTLAFASEVLEGIRDESVRNHIRRVVVDRLPGGGYEE